MSTPITVGITQEASVDHDPQRFYRSYAAEVLVEMLERQVDQGQPLNVEVVFELAVRVLEAEATTRRQ